jgi:hypothetical protein
MKKANQWKAAGWNFHADKRKADTRPRKRHREDNPFRNQKKRIRKACPTCVEQGLAKPCFMQTFAWCEGHCKKHAKEKDVPVSEPSKIMKNGHEDLDSDTQEHDEEEEDPPPALTPYTIPQDTAPLTT